MGTLVFGLLILSPFAGFAIALIAKGGTPAYWRR